MPQPIYLTGEIREIERKAGATCRSWSARAGRPRTWRRSFAREKDILVLAGPGNNGGDARIAAARLEERFFRVKVVEPSARAAAREELGTGDRRPVRHRARARHHGRLRAARRVREPPALPGARARRTERDPVRHRPGARLRGARDAHDHLHRAEAGPAHAGRPGPLRRDPGGGARSRFVGRKAERLGRRPDAASRTCSSPGRATSTRETPARSASSAARAG